MDEVTSWKNTKGQLRDSRHKKSKFKDKSKVVSSTAKEDTMPTKLESNAYRYEDKSIEDPEEKDTSRDFSLLSQTSSSQGYFQFKSDIEMLQGNGPAIENTFTLDLNLLSLSLSMIPFHIRHEFQPDYFSKEEIDEMVKIANANEEKFESFVQVKHASNSEQNSGKESVPKMNATENNIVCNEENATKHQGKEKKHHANKSQEDGNSREELEDFLDDLLDD